MARFKWDPIKTLNERMASYFKAVWAWRPMPVFCVSFVCSLVWSSCVALGFKHYCFLALSFAYEYYTASSILSRISVANPWKACWTSCWIGSCIFLVMVGWDYTDPSINTYSCLIHTFFWGGLGLSWVFVTVWAFLLVVESGDHL